MSDNALKKSWIGGHSMCREQQALYIDEVPMKAAMTPAALLSKIVQNPQQAEACTVEYVLPLVVQSQAENANIACVTSD